MFGAAVFRLGYRVGAECVGLDYIGSCGNIFLMYALYDIRACQIKAFIVALQFFTASGKRTAAVIFFGQCVFLYHGAHGTVQYIYSFFEIHHGILSEKTEQYTGCNGRSDYSCDIRCHCMHEKMVFRVELTSNVL